MTWEPVLGLYVPGVHNVHTDRPAGDQLPESHAVQAAAVELPIFAFLLPAGHSVHTAWPLLAANVPTEQFWQMAVDPSLNVPGSQLTQAEEPMAEIPPIGQVRQAVGEVEALLAL